MGAPAEKLHAVDPKEDLLFLIRAFIKYNASDMHLRPNRPPLYRINGRLLPASMPALSAQQIEQILNAYIPDIMRNTLQTKRQIDFSFEIEELGRFRCNVFYATNRLSCAIRRIPFEIPPIEKLRVPEVLKDLVTKSRGLLLITGSTGSGKSTTMASLIQHLNDTQRLHVVTIEDPIEYVFKDQKAVITQRELGVDFPSMNEALASCMRQDPDVIVVGEMRDYVTIQTAITAAETGHLVISTLHTNDAKSALDRILDMFPADHKNQIRVQLASSLIGIVAQQLLVRADGKGRVLASEVLVKSPSVEHAIRTHQFEMIPDLMGKSELYYKMQTMNMDLERLIRGELITLEEGVSASLNPDDLKLRLAGIDRKEGYEYGAESTNVESTIEYHNSKAAGGRKGD
ncbi:MAG: PilT/PilU family type 4a pilus ATPase [Bdellovibrionales bacterium]|nr:PilT/PilU family type 4a pilus ATPase [Bdellovibrionales bacterium]